MSARLDPDPKIGQNRSFELETETGPLPDFVIIGAMKAATSTLHEQLGHQPGIFMSMPKEPNFFSDDVVYARGLNWYRSLFVEAPTGALKGESSTHYTKRPTYPNACDRLWHHLPETKLIYVMRHPIDRLISHYIHEWTQAVISEPLEQALNTQPELIQYSLYAWQIEPYLRSFGPEQVLPVFSERLQADPQGELERTCRFLGYEGQPHWQTDWDQRNRSTERLRRSPWRDAIVEAPVLRTIRRRLVPRSIRNRIKRFWQMTQRPEVPIDQLESLTARFDADLERLGTWLGVDLCCDNFKTLVANQSLDWATSQFNS